MGNFYVITYLRSLHLTFRQKIILQILLLIILLFAITSKNNIVDLLIVVCMVIGLISEFIKTERTIRITISTVLFWLIYVLIIFYWTKCPGFLEYIYLEVFKIIIILSAFIINKKSNPQNSIIGKLWVVGLFIYFGEIILNSTFGFKSLYFATTLISLFYIMFNTILSKIQQGN